MSTNYITSLAEGATLNHTTFNTLAAAIDGKLTDMNSGAHNFSAINIDGGTIDNTAIGGATPAAAVFSTLNVSSTLPGPAWHVTMSVTQNITATTAALVQFDTEVLDSASNYNTGTYTMTPTTEGYYFVVAHVTWTAAFNVNKQTYLSLVSATVNTESHKETVGVVVESLIVADIVKCNGSSDTIQIYAYNGDSVTRTLSNNTYASWVAGWRIQ